MQAISQSLGQVTFFPNLPPARSNGSSAAKGQKACPKRPRADQSFCPLSCCCHFKYGYTLFVSQTSPFGGLLSVLFLSPSLATICTCPGVVGNSSVTPQQLLFYNLLFSCFQCIMDCDTHVLLALALTGLGQSKIEFKHALVFLLSQSSLRSYQSPSAFCNAVLQCLHCWRADTPRQ